VKYSDLFLYVLSEVPGCPEFTAERAIRDACIDFFGRTDLWRADPLSLICLAGITDYELESPTGTEPNHVKQVLRAGRPLEQMMFEDAFSLIEQSERSAPSFWTQTDNGTLMLGPKPAAKETLKVLYTLKPTTSSTSIPDTHGLEWREVLVSGALFRLQMMAGSPWANGGGAQANNAIYEDGVKAAIKRAKYGHGGASMTVHSREFI